MFENKYEKQLKELYVKYKTEKEARAAAVSDATPGESASMAFLCTRAIWKRICVVMILMERVVFLVDKPEALGKLFADVSGVEESFLKILSEEQKKKLEAIQDRLYEKNKDSYDKANTMFCGDYDFEDYPQAVIDAYDVIWVALNYYIRTVKWFAKVDNANKACNEEEG